MTRTALRALLFLCLVLGLCLWFRRVWKVMKARREAVDIAEKQLQKAENCSDFSNETFSAVLTRSASIYRQAVVMYNQTLRHPLRRLPAALMGFRSLSDVDSTIES